MHIIFNSIVICPSGPNHPYNIITKQYLTPLDPQFEGDWDLKCVYFESSKKFLISFLQNKGIKGSQFYYTNDDVIKLKEISFLKQIYDYKISNVGEEGIYPMIFFLKSSEGDNTLNIERDNFFIDSKSPEYIIDKTIIDYLSNTKGYF